MEAPTFERERKVQYFRMIFSNATSNPINSLNLKTSFFAHFFEINK